jgi:hypothetical protein
MQPTNKFLGVVAASALADWLRDWPRRLSPAVRWQSFRHRTGLKPARWEGTVKVYTDLGTLGVVDNAQANQLVRNALQQWSSVPTSSFRAQVVGTMADIGLGDITGANAASIIGADNGGGIHVIYDADGTVLADFMGVGYGVLGIATPEFLESEGSSRIVEGWAIITAEGEGVEEVVTGGPLAGVITHELGHAIGLAHTQTNGLYFRNQPIEAWGRTRGIGEGGSGSMRIDGQDLSDHGTGRDHVSVHRSLSHQSDVQQSRHGDRQRGRTTSPRCRHSIPHATTGRRPARSRVASSRRMA